MRIDVDGSEIHDSPWLAHDRGELEMSEEAATIAVCRAKSARRRRWTVENSGERERAMTPEGLGRPFLDRGNAGDVDGLIALYEPDAVPAFRSGQVVVGIEAIRRVYQPLLAGKPTFQGVPQPAFGNGDLALTSTRFGSGVTAEPARRQPDGTWLWMIGCARTNPGSRR